MTETIYLDLNEYDEDQLIDIDSTKPDEFDAQAIKLAEGFETLKIIQDGIQRTPLSRMKDPAYVAGLESQVSNLAKSLGLESYTPVVQVSQEGAVWDTLKRWFIAVLEFLKKVGKFLWDMLKGFLGFDAGHKQATEEILSKVNDNAHATNDKGDIIFKLPTKALCIFHSSKFMPKVNYKYNFDTYMKSQKQIAIDSETVAKAMLEDVLSYAPDIVKISQAMLDKASIDPNSLTSFEKTGKLGQLAHNKFSYIGASIIQTPVWRRTTGQKTNKPLFVNKSNDWGGNDTVDFVIRRDKIGELTVSVSNHIKAMDKQTSRAIDAVVGSKTINKLKFAEQVDVSTIFNDSTEEQLHRQLQRMLAEANDIVKYVKAVSSFYGNYSKRYTKMLVVLIKELNAGL